MKIKPLAFRNGARNEADTVSADGFSLSGYRGDMIVKAAGPTPADAVGPVPQNIFPSAGSIAFTGFNADGTDDISFVLIEDIAAGSVIYFTDNEWNGTAFADAAEGRASLTFNNAFTAGTIITVSSMSGTSSSTAGTTYANITNSINLNAGDEVLYAYTANAGSPTVPVTFLAAIANGGFSATNGVLTNTALTDGTNAVNVGTIDDDLDIAAYNGLRNNQASFSAYLSQVNTAANWIAQDGTGNQDQDSTAPDIPFSTTAFSLAAGGETQTVQFNPQSVGQNEGDSGTTAYVFTVTRTGGTTGQLDFSGTIGSNPGGPYSGTNDADFVGGTAPTTFSGSIPEGQTSVTVTVNIAGDLTIEPDESFALSLDTATNTNGSVTVVFGGGGAFIEGFGYIINDDSNGTISVGDVTLAEGDAGTTAGSFTVTRTGGVTGTVSVDYLITLPGGVGGADGSDVSGPLSGTVTFLEGETSATIPFTVNGDLSNEPDETFTVAISNPQGGATIGDGSGTATITNDDAPPTLSISDASLVEGNDGVTYLVFTVTMSKAAIIPITVNYNMADNSAVDGSDYLAVSGELTFAVGDTSETISVPVIGDTVPENNETFTVALFNPSAGATIADGVATGTITNDDGSGYYSLASGSFTQNWTDTGQITANDNWSGVPFIIGYLGDIDGGSTTNVDARTLTGANLGAIDVIANLANTTSNSGGVGEFHIADPVVGLQGSGTADAPSLVLYMDASGRSNVRLQANLRDIDNSAPGGTEDNSAQQINVQYRTSPGGTWTNVPGGYFADVTTLGASNVTALDVTLPADANNAATLEIRIMTTNAAGNDEWVGIDDIVVSSQTSGPVLSIANTAVVEGDAGTTPITFTVTRTGETTGAVSATWTVSFGGGAFDAQANDFDSGQLFTGTVNFADGETSQTITLDVQGDLTAEGDDDFTVTLTSPVGGTIGDGSATGTIVNDDGAPIQVSIGDASIVEGDSGTVAMVFTVTRTGGTGAFDVDFSTSDLTATSAVGPGQDYVTSVGTVNFLAGEMSRTISIDIVGDTDAELAETFQVNLLGATNGALITDNVAIGTILPDDPIYIHMIQGTSYFSPILAAEGISTFNTATTGFYTVRAIVTAVDNDGNRQGFYVQEELADWDGNTFTSEGIFVMTRNDAGVGSAVSGVGVGDLVTVTAHVMEYQGFSSNMPITAMTGASSIIVNSSGNPLPAMTLGAMPTAIMTPVQPDYTDSSDGAGDTFDASLYALSYWETVEGMLVTVPDVVVADGFFSTSGGQPIFQAYSQSLTDADQINSRGGLTIAGDPPVGPPDTADPLDDTNNGGRALTDGDINPDIIEIDFSGFAIDAPGGLAGTLSMGDYLGDVTGIIDFDFTDRKLFVTDIDPGTFVNNTTTQDVTALGNDDRSLTVATFNVENLDPGDGAARFAALADAIANNLNAPDIICIEEMQDNNGATASGGADASTTWGMLVAALNAATGKVYQWVDQDPVAGSEGGEPGGNIRVGFLYDTGRVQLGNLDANATLAERRQYTDRIGDGVRDAGDLIAFDDSMLGAEIQTGDWAGTRRSLLGEFNFHGNTVYVTANHWPAKSGSDDFWQFNQNPAAGEPTNSGWTQRNNVAQDVYSMLNLIETNAPGGGIVSGGDYNDFYFYRPMTTMTGHTLADGTARVGGTRLENLTITLPEAERYTYNFDGRSQAIDHIVVNATLGAVATYDVVHLNTGFNSGDSTPLSDHDPGLSSFDFRNFSEDLLGTAGADLIDGFGGDDFIDGAAGADRLIGGTGDDSFRVDQSADEVIERAGEGTRDVVYAFANYNLGANAEVEVLSAGSQAGTTALELIGNAFGQEIYGNAGANYLQGGGGTDYLVGLGGNDIYFVVGSGDHVVEGAGGGTRDVVYAAASYSLEPGAEIEVLSAASQAGTSALSLTGNGFGQEIYGNAGANVIDGGGGTDLLVGLGGNDVYFVDSADDFVAESAAGGRDVVYTTTSYTLATYEEIEVLSTSSSAGSGAIDLTGNLSNNELYGNAGVNVLDGGRGTDFMVGFAGADTFQFTTAIEPGNVDTIGDFLSGTDKIALDDAVFAGIGTPGAFNANAFATGAAAGDADDRIIYNAATGQLFYDADGNGAGAAILFATLQGAPVLTASDFTVI